MLIPSRSGLVSWAVLGGAGWLTSFTVSGEPVTATGACIHGRAPRQAPGRSTGWRSIRTSSSARRRRRRGTSYALPGCIPRWGRWRSTRRCPHRLSPTPVRHYGLSSVTYQITTAMRAFNQGLRLTYAFNHARAQRRRRSSIPTAPCVSSAFPLLPQACNLAKNGRGFVWREDGSPYPDHLIEAACRIP